MNGVAGVFRSLGLRDGGYSAGRRLSGRAVAFGFDREVHHVGAFIGLDRDSLRHHLFDAVAGGANVKLAAQVDVHDKIDTSLVIGNEPLLSHPVTVEEFEDDTGGGSASVFEGRFDLYIDPGADHGPGVLRQGGNTEENGREADEAGQHEGELYAGAMDTAELARGSIVLRER